MIRRPAIAAASLFVLAACGGGDDETATTVETILVTTTTPTSEPVFVPVDSGPDAEVDPNDDADPDAGADDGSTDGDPPAATDVVSTDAPVVTVAPADSVPDTAPASSTPDTTPDTETDVDFTLDVDGIGATSFGADPDGTISFVSSFFGAPTSDTGWVDPFEIGPCGGTELRQVAWGDLQLEFGDVSNVTEGRQHFYAYTYGVEGSLGVVVPSGLATPLGITVGSTVADLVGEYPTVELRSADEFIAANFFVNQNLSGRMSGLADDDVVEVIIGGIPCAG